MNLSKENQTLLALLGYVLFGRELTISAEGVDWDQVVAEADRHAVTAFLYPGVKRLVKLFVGQIGENIAPIIPLQRHTAPGHHAGGNNCGICGSQTDAKKRPLPQTALRGLPGLSAFSRLRHLSLPQRGADLFLPAGAHGQCQTGVFREGRAVVARSRGLFCHPPGRSPEPGGHCGQSVADGSGGVPVSHGTVGAGKGNPSVAGHTGRLRTQRVGRSHPADHPAGHAGCGRLGVQYGRDGGGIPAIPVVFSTESKNIKHIDAISIQFSYLNRSVAFQRS